ncbi:hypothetical protein GCM10010172_39510 [Paractinoplanes ferrugineus]|uniref:Uncharacterized protein n=1 Tax=Paractinoplanes ferrugineus TaxID=113564 RepID=A0A919J2I1_9ACTN|nr:hypothetical protein Afe05nite_45680 [Actinoplanes ferrugineus]
MRGWNPSAAGGEATYAAWQRLRGIGNYLIRLWPRLFGGGAVPPLQQLTRRALPAGFETERGSSPAGGIAGR